MRVEQCSVTSYFDCNSGVKQGCIMSPLLFSLFMSELQEHLNAVGLMKVE